jgi:antirestriction protein ArdC
MTKKAREILDNLVERITTENTLEFIHGKLFSDTIDIPCKKWSFLNQFLVFLSNTNDARGIRHWAKVGRKLNKGCKAIYILVPMITQIKEEKAATGSDAGEPKIQKVSGYKAMPVFRVEDTFGAPLDYEVILNSFDPAKFPLIEVADSLGVKVEAAILKNAYGVFSMNENKILMDSDDAQTFLHELSHAIDYKLPGFKNDLVINEIVAELSSAFLGSLYGVNVDLNNTIAYIKGYNGKADIVINVMKALNRVEEIYKYIRKSKLDNLRKIKPNIA